MKFALRQLFKSPGFTVISLLTLTLGIGLNTTTFSLTNAVLYRTPAFSHSKDLVLVVGTIPQNPFESQSPANVRDEFQQNTVFSHISAFCQSSPNLARPGEPARRYPGLSVGGNFFAVLGVSPILGRSFTLSDEGPGHDDVVLVSEQFWKTNMGGSAAAVGSVLRIDGKPSTVIGVMPDGCQDYMMWGGAIDLWQPFGYTEEGWQIRDNNWLNVIARLKPGVSLHQAQAQMSTVAARLAHDYPVVNAQRGLGVLPYLSSRSLGARRISYIVMGLMLFVLMIACVNLANLQLARTARRSREHAIRIALGASRFQIIRELLVESVLLSMMGGVLGLLVAMWGNRLLGSRLQIVNFGDGQEGLYLPIDHRVLGFTFIVSLATGVLFGLMPGWIASRTDVNRSLKQSGRGSTGDKSRHRMRQALVIGELAMALALLAGASYFVRGAQRVSHVDTGWQSRNVVSGNFVLSYNTFATNDQVRSVVDRIRTSLLEIPGVDQAAITGSVPIYGFSHRDNFIVEGAPNEKGLAPLAFIERITPGYFSTLGISLARGRDFTTADRADSQQVVIINRAMADHFWPNGNALGHRIADADAKVPQYREIVGIVNNVSFPANPGTQMTEFQTYRPFTQDPEHWLAFVIHSTGNAASLNDAARKAVMRVDSDLAVFNLGTTDATIERSGANMALIGNLLTIAAAMGFFLALIGIYGVVANLAAQRTQEIGIRMALGANANSVLWLVLRNGGQLAALGTGIGLVASFALTHGLSLAEPDIPGSDPALIIGMAAVLVAGTLLACWLPALKATRVNPVEALRSE